MDNSTHVEYNDNWVAMLASHLSGYKWNLNLTKCFHLTLTHVALQECETQEKLLLKRNISATLASIQQSYFSDMGAFEIYHCALQQEWSIKVNDK